MEELNNNMELYLNVDKQIKALEEDKKLYKDAIELWMKENKQTKVNNDLGQVSISEIKGSKRLNKALAEKFLEPVELAKIMKESAPSVRVSILSKESVEARNKFFKNKAMEELKKKKVAEE